MKDGFLPCRRLGFLERDSEMEMCVQMLYLGERSGEEYQKETQGSRSWQREKLGSHVVVTESSAAATGSTGAGWPFRVVPNWAEGSGPIIPSAPSSLPLSLGCPNDRGEGRHLGKHSSFYAVGNSLRGTWLWADGSPHAQLLREGLPHSRIGSGVALYFKLRKMESDKNLGLETKKKCECL